MILSLSCNNITVIIQMLWFMSPNAIGIIYHLLSVHCHANKGSRFVQKCKWHNLANNIFKLIHFQCVCGFYSLRTTLKWLMDPGWWWSLPGKSAVTRQRRAFNKHHQQCPPPFMHPIILRFKYGNASQPFAAWCCALWHWPEVSQIGKSIDRGKWMLLHPAHYRV